MYFTDTTPEFWQKVISINYVGVLNGTRAALRYMPSPINECTLPLLESHTRSR